jgi:hypothetical protein
MVDAEWVVDGNIVAHWSHVPDDPRVVTDGDGGAIFVWAEPNRENSGSYNIFAQRMRRSGEIAWPLNGVPIGASEHYQRGPVIVPDGCGGAIIVWQDTGPDYWTHMAAQRIDSVGTCVWASDGLLISTTSAGEPKLASLGDGRSIVIWEASHRIYAQCLGQLGELPWGQSGRAISPPEREAEKPHIVPDSNGGALVCWTDLDHQTFAQRVDSLGDLTWSAQGIAVTTNSIDEMQLQMVPDINGGALLAWQYYDKDVYAQKLTCEGALVWPAGGVRLSITAAWSLSPKLVSDGIGGAVVTWQEDLEIDLVLAQRIGEDGTLLWTPTGITVGAGGVPEIVSDGSEGVIVSWRGTGLESTCVEAQRIDAAGTKMWGVNVVRAAMGETGDFLQATATTDNAAIVSM